MEYLLLKDASSLTGSKENKTIKDLGVINFHGRRDWWGGGVHVLHSSLKSNRKTME